MNRIVCLLLGGILSFSYNSYGRDNGGSTNTTIFITIANNYRSPFDDLKGKKYEGYIVFKQDTVRGWVSFKSGGIVVVENEMFNRIARHDLDNKQLQDIVLVNSAGKKLHLIKFKNYLSMGKYYRVVHKGQLPLYDRHFAFGNDPRDIDFESLAMVNNNKIKELGSFPVLSVKHKLIEIINKTYNTDLSPKDYTKGGLKKYVVQLN